MSINFVQTPSKDSFYHFYSTVQHNIFLQFTTRFNHNKVLFLGILYMYDSFANIG